MPKKIKEIKEGDFGVGLIRCDVKKEKIHCNNLDKPNKAVVDEVRLNSENVFWFKAKDFLNKQPHISISHPVQCTVSERRDLNERYLNCEDI